MHGQTHPACGYKTFFYFAMMMCEGSLKAHIPKLKAKSNYFGNKKTQGLSDTSATGLSLF